MGPDAPVGLLEIMTAAVTLILHVPCKRLL